MIGETLGQYRLTKQLGKGGFATVYKALQPTLNRDVAVKVLHPEFIRDVGAIRRFKREALAVAKLAHPNIVAVYDYGEHDGRAYLVMEYVAGNTLKGRLGKPVGYQLSLDLVTAVGSALDYAHSKGMVHRDVKPANILFTEDNRIVLSDFGIVRLANDDSSLTRGVIGTPQYMSPEQAIGQPVDGRSDLYSLGVVLFEMLSGRVPYKGESAVATLSMHATLPVPSVRDLNPEISWEVDAVVRQALGKNPDERFQTGKELSAALTLAIADTQRPPEPTIVVPSKGPTPTAVTADLARPKDPEVPKDAESPKDLDAMYRELVVLTRSEQWRRAVELAAQILGRDPSYRDVSAILASASNELRFGRSATSVEIQLKAMLRKAETAASEGRLIEAASMLQQVLRSSPNESEARSRLDEVNRRLSDQESQRRREVRLGQLYTLAQSKIHTGDWSWANHILEEISSIDPSFRDVPQLLAQARASLRAESGDPTPSNHVPTLRAQADAAMTEERWADAVKLWQSIMRVEPNLTGVRERLILAQQRLLLSTLNDEAAQLAADGKWQEAIQKIEEIKNLTAKP
ncbi:MAG: hypothetical protein HW416_926 [Chloroflexi bacterium]|nr:hypothetical protein [Chloroflexota bacterium]